MDLGAFSISLTVKDLNVSREFYEKLGFVQQGGNAEENWLILKNGEHVIGLFKGMFKQNILTFVPGWDQSGQETSSFTDIRVLQAQLKQNGIALVSEVDPDSTGPANIFLEDPDGNQILIDQHR